MHYSFQKKPNIKIVTLFAVYFIFLGGCDNKTAPNTAGSELISYSQNEFIKTLIRQGVESDDFSLSDVQSIESINDFKSKKANLSQLCDRRSKIRINLALENIQKQKESSYGAGGDYFTKARNEASKAQAMASMKYQLDNYYDGIDLEALRTISDQNTKYIWDDLNGATIRSVKLDPYRNVGKPMDPAIEEYFTGK